MIYGRLWREIDNMQLPNSLKLLITGNRSKIITRSILRGYTFQQVALVFKISDTRVRDIFYSIVSLIYQHDYKVRDIRKHRNYIIAQINEAII